MEKRSLSKQALAALLNQAIGKGTVVIGPRKKGQIVEFNQLQNANDITDDYIQTKQSAKHVVFPPTEELFRFKNTKDGVQLTDPKEPKETLLFGIRPCDAASFATLKAVFNWGSEDILFNKRLAKTTVIAVSCTKADQYCFCTSVGLDPGSTAGSDILLTPLASGDYLAEILTEKGQVLVKQAGTSIFGSEPVADKEKSLAKVPAHFTKDVVEKKLAALFNSDIWLKQSKQCLGCGACAFLCPACMCFDIQEEGTQSEGVRLRCWDACGNSLFTLHTSGHNPREVQSQRWRQRIMHKFSYLPDRLGVLGCVGCGRCSRSCPADMNIVEHLQAIVEA